MKLYLIGILVAVIGLLVANEVQARDLCGLRSSRILSVVSWSAERVAEDRTRYIVALGSRDEKTIRRVGGSVAFFDKSDRLLLEFPIVLSRPVAARGKIVLEFADRISLPTAVEIAAACIDSVDYADGSGVIIN